MTTDSTAENDYFHAPLWEGVLHREVQTFRWELPKTACGIVLHPYKTLGPWMAENRRRCEVCYPPGQVVDQ